jgi:hypothetical protein
VRKSASKIVYLDEYMKYKVCTAPSCVESPQMEQEDRLPPLVADRTILACSARQTILDKSLVFLSVCCIFISVAHFEFPMCYCYIIFKKRSLFKKAWLSFAPNASFVKSLTP